MPRAPALENEASGTAEGEHICKAHMCLQISVKSYLGIIHSLYLHCVCICKIVNWQKFVDKIGLNLIYNVGYI